MNSAAAAICINDLRFAWPGQREPWLCIPAFRVERGERVFLQGASGSGKSTLLNLLTGLLPCRPGEIELLGHDLGAMRDSARDRLRAREVGQIFQQFNLVPFLDIEDNIRLPGRFSGRGSHQTRQQLEALLDALQLDRSLLRQRADQLSVGQQQRVAVARAFYNSPALLIADEPTSALDADSRDSFIQLLVAMQQTSKGTLLFVSHDKELACHFDRVVAMTALNQAAQTGGLNAA